MRPLFKNPLFSRRTVTKTVEREEILVAQDTSGNEDWVDFQEYLDRTLMMVEPVEPLSIAEYKAGVAVLIKPRPDPT